MRRRPTCVHTRLVRLFLPSFSVRVCNLCDRDQPGQLDRRQEGLRFRVQPMHMQPSGCRGRLATPPLINFKFWSQHQPRSSPQTTLSCGQACESTTTICIAETTAVMRKVTACMVLPQSPFSASVSTRPFPTPAWVAACACWAMKMRCCYAAMRYTPYSLKVAL